MSQRPIISCPCGYKSRNDYMKHHKKKCKALTTVTSLQSQLDEVKKENAFLMSQLLSIASVLKTVDVGAVERRGGHLYILKTREHFRQNENIYKIGKTENMTRRLSRYPKESQLLKEYEVNDRHACELKLMDSFASRFRLRSDIGREYFEGDIHEMLRVFDEVVSDFTD